jgi:formyl-CoA transferase
MQHAAALNALIEAWTRTHSSAELVRVLFEEQDVPAAIVRKPTEVLSDAALHARGAVTQLQHPAMGTAQAVGMGNPIQFSKAHAQFDIPAQALGEANAEIYGGLLQLSEQEMAQLRSEGVI